MLCSLIRLFGNAKTTTLNYKHVKCQVQIQYQQHWFNYCDKRSSTPASDLHRQQYELEGRSDLLLPSVCSWNIKGKKEATNYNLKRRPASPIWIITIRSGEKKNQYYNRTSCIHFLLILAWQNYFSLAKLLPLPQKRSIAIRREGR